MLAQLLITRMGELHMSQADLARATKLSDAAVSKFLRGILINPTAETIDAFATALQLSREAIIAAAVADQRALPKAPPEPLQRVVEAVA